MRRNLNIGIVGFGNMGRALAYALLDGTEGCISIYEKDKKKIKGLKNLLISENAKELIETADVVILAIKPQDIKKFLKETKYYFLNKKPILISIAAGIPTYFFERYVKQIRVIRVMPNLAAKVRESISFICKGKFAKNKDLEIAKRIFRYVGEVIIIKEGFLNKVTSISGSGPGYVYYFMDCLYKSALELGFQKKIAKRMVEQTFRGAIKLAKLSGKDFNLLVKAVASPKGTTLAALKIFKKRKLKGIIASAVNAAHKRAKELSIN